MCLEQLTGLRWGINLVQGFDKGDLIAEPFQSAVDAFQDHVVKGVAVFVDARNQQDADMSPIGRLPGLALVGAAILPLYQAGFRHFLKVAPDSRFGDGELLGEIARGQKFLGSGILRAL